MTGSNAMRGWAKNGLRFGNSSPIHDLRRYVLPANNGKNSPDSDIFLSLFHKETREWFDAKDFAKVFGSSERRGSFARVLAKTLHFPPCLHILDYRNMEHQDAGSRVVQYNRTQLRTT